MIEKIKILELVNQALEGTDKFLVNLKVTPDNRIYVDGDNGVTIDDCIELSRAIESRLDRDEEDFALDVSSAGADQPLKLTRQMVKNIGREVEAMTFDGRLAVRLSVSDLFDANRYESRSYAPSYTAYSSSHYTSRFLTFGLSWRFGKLDLEWQARGGAAAQ